MVFFMNDIWVRAVHFTTRGEPALSSCVHLNSYSRWWGGLQILAYEMGISCTATSPSLLPLPTPGSLGG